MSIRSSLLAVLDQGPSYGYLLRSEFDRRTGGAWPLNTGQVYTTLDRLERDGLVVAEGRDDRGRVRFAITEEGRAEVQQWLTDPVPREEVARDEVAMKLAIAASLPAVDVARVIQVQRAASMAHLQNLTRSKNATRKDERPDVAWLLVVDSLIFHAEAEIRWLDHSQTTLAKLRRSGTATALPPLPEPDRRTRTPFSGSAN